MTRIRTAASMWLLAAAVGVAAPHAAEGPLSARVPSALAGAACDSLELSAPRGKLLDSGRVMLRWRAAGNGPFEVRIVGEDGSAVYAATTFGHEMRVLVSRGEGTMRGPSADQLEAGRTYRWTVRPANAPGGSECPPAKFRILSAKESTALEATLAEAAAELKSGAEREGPEAGLAMAKLYADEELYVLAEGELEALIEQGWDDPAIDALLADLYRKTGRELSLRALPAGTPGR